MNATCLIVDDEPLAVQLLEKHVKDSGMLVLSGCCSDAMEASNILRTNQVDLLLLDIQMPKLTGIDFLKMLKPAPSVIFTTAHRSYALEGYELDVVDYLVKPISFERFMAAIQKFYRKHTADSLVNSSTDSQQVKKIVQLHSGAKTYQINEADIVYIESLRDYIQVHFEDGKKLMFKYRIGQLEAELSNNFLRVHKSYIVHKNKISVFSGQLIELGEIIIPVGSHYKPFVDQLIKKPG
ncbi:MAG: LytR/AlgR family response regulator transcription factor [Sediminibacterium sp.]